MQIVVANNATMAVSSYVSYMKQQGFNKNNLIKSKNAMLRFVNGFINRAISGKTDDEPVWRTCYWRDGYTPMTWYFTFYILPQQNLVLIVSFYSQEGSPNVNENRQVIRLNESQLRGMIEKHLKKILNEMREPVGKIGEFEIIDGSWGTYRCESLKDFEPFNDVRMYYSDEHTYCLMRREDNGTFFFAEIVPAPELGKNETKFEPKRPSEVPNKILRDAKNYLHNSPIFEK